MKILVFQYVYDRGPNVVMFKPVGVPDNVVTWSDVVDWLPTLYGYEDTKYMVIDSNRRVDLLCVGESWGERDE